MNSPINDNITSVLFDLIYKTDFYCENNLNILNIGRDVRRIYNPLSDKYPKCNIYNIEMGLSYEKNISDIPNTVFKTITDLSLDFPKDFFDIIIIDDCIQRFIDPWSTMKYIHQYLKKDGYLFSSIPNMMHITNLINIIQGRFEFTNSGPLDEDNIRYFTLNGIRDLFLSCGYNILEISSVSTEKNPEVSSIINAITPSNEPDFTNQYLCFQYILKSSACQIKTLFDYIS